MRNAYRGFRAPHRKLRADNPRREKMSHEHRLCGPLPLADERPIAQLSDRLLQLGLGVHDDRAIPRNRLLDWLARDQQEPDALVAGLDRDLVSAVEQHERAVAGALADQGVSALAFLLGQDAERLRRIAERARSREHVGEGLPRGLDREGLASARRHGDVEITRIRRDPLHGTTLAPELAANDADAGAVVVDDLRDFRAGHVLIARRGHLQRRGQVRPELEPVHPPPGGAFRHFLMEEAAAGRHPLDVAGTQRAAIAEAVAVIHRPGQDIGDGLDSAVRMPRKSGAIVLRALVAEIVEQQERIEVSGIAEAERPAQLHPRPLHGGLRFDNPLDGSNGHDASQALLIARPVCRHRRHPRREQVATPICGPRTSAGLRRAQQSRQICIFWSSSRSTGLRTMPPSSRSTSGGRSPGRGWRSRTGACPRPSVAAGGAGLPWTAGGTGLPRLLSWAAGAEGAPWASATLETVVCAVTAAASRASHAMIPGAARRAPRRAKASCMFASS